jgi:hypothetical protein
MSPALKRKRGAPRDNQNARKHGFYSKVRTDTEKEALLRAGVDQGIDAEIALRRIKLRAVLEYNPANLRLVSHAIISLARLICAKQELLENEKEGENL